MTPQDATGYRKTQQDVRYHMMPQDAIGRRMKSQDATGTPQGYHKMTQNAAGRVLRRPTASCGVL